MCDCSYDVDGTIVWSNLRGCMLDITGIHVTVLADEPPEKPSKLAVTIKDLLLSGF